MISGKGICSVDRLVLQDLNCYCERNHNLSRRNSLLTYSPRTMRMRSTVLLGSVFLRRLALWNSTVRGAIPRVRAISLLEYPPDDLGEHHTLARCEDGLVSERTSSAPFSFLISCLACLSSGVSRNSHSPFAG